MDIVVDEETFQRFAEHLIDLRLDDCQLPSLPNKVFWNLQRLRNLHLNGINLGRLDDELLRGLVSL